jgi:hypothetical protein
MPDLSDTASPAPHRHRRPFEARWAPVQLGSGDTGECAALLIPHVSRVPPNTLGGRFSLHLNDVRVGIACRSQQIRGGDHGFGSRGGGATAFLRSTAGNGQGDKECAAPTDGLERKGPCEPALGG